MSGLRDTVHSHSLFTSSRLYSLYSDFRKLKEVNPDGYEANLTAWNSLIDELFQKGLFQHTFILDTKNLEESLTLSSYGKPLCLALVLEELVRSNDLIPYAEFIDRKDSIYLKRWVKPFLKQFINHYIYDTSYKLSDRNNNLKVDKLISKKTLELFESELLKELTQKKSVTAQLFHREELKNYINSLNIKLFSRENRVIHLSDLDFDIFLKYLERDSNKIRVCGDVVKFDTEQITDQDISILEIKSLVIKITKSNDLLSDKINSATLALKNLVKQKSYNKELSFNLLKSRKIAENSLAKQISSLNQLESIIYKIDESATNIQLLDALQKGTIILKGLNTQIGGVEKVESIIDELEGEKYKVEKITERINDLSKGDEIDNNDLEVELDELLKQETNQKLSVVDEERHTEEDISQKLRQLKLEPTSVKIKEDQHEDIEESLNTQLS
ncbi:hypothetical protein WICMUC_004352 [Wickerhamomyces mucosus]|uniref:Vacuolar-sorting protein SNF7 n=1 Tax=Wickerhamomyces mucosus TaxID=1378264 RepID=A0A9P8PHM8_9ASCO|nr:hypothetical protein WICMUC_004352 [Wickerhamomyces mucosus]